MTFKNLLYFFFTCQNKHHKASVIVFTTSLEAALVLCNDSGPFSATPEMDADRKNFRCGLLPITESTKFIFRPTPNYWETQEQSNIDKISNVKVIKTLFRIVDRCLKMNHLYSPDQLQLSAHSLSVAGSLFHHNHHPIP